MGQITLAYPFRKLTVIAVIMLYKDSKDVVSSLIQIFNIASDVLHRDT